VKIPLERTRKYALCMLSTRICEAVRFHLPILELEEIRCFCLAVSDNCKRLNCEEPANLCKLAAEAKSEKEFMKHCSASVVSCRTSRKGKAKKEAQFYMS